jgi:hypothetical protein
MRNGDDTASNAPGRGDRFTLYQSGPPGRIAAAWTPQHTPSAASRPTPTNRRRKYIREAP